jgi:hypothetical protein
VRNPRNLGKVKSPEENKTPREVEDYSNYA